MNDPVGLPKRQPGEARIVAAPSENWAHKLIETVTGVPLDPSWYRFASPQDKFMTLAPIIGTSAISGLRAIGNTLKGSAKPIRTLQQGVERSYVPEEMFESNFFSHTNPQPPGVQMGLADMGVLRPEHGGLSTIPNAVRVRAARALADNVPRTVRAVGSEVPISRREFFQASRELPKDMKIDRHMRDTRAYDAVADDPNYQPSYDSEEFGDWYSPEQDEAWDRMAESYGDVMAPTVLDRVRKAVAAGQPVVEAQRMLTRPEGVNPAARRAFLRFLTGQGQ